MSRPAAHAAAEAPPPFDCAPVRPEREGREARRRRVVRGVPAGAHPRGRRGWRGSPAVVVAALYLWLIAWSGLLESPMMAFWLVLGAVLAFVAYKVGRRVFFDVLRGRATGDRG